MSISFCGRARSRTGFTLVELLVVIAIIGVLVGLLLPAVQAAREAGRRAQCQNNLKQLGLAANAHLSTHGHMPTGGWGRLWVGDADRGVGTNQPGGWVYNLLPFVEQQNLHDVTAGQTVDQKKTGNAALMVPLPFMNCPTRRTAKLFANTAKAPTDEFKNAPERSKLAGLPRTDYAANAGPGAKLEHEPGPATLTTGFSSPPPTNYGIISERSMVKQAHIKDGMSNTMLFGEKYLDITGYSSGNNKGDDDCMFTGHNNDIARVFGSAGDAATASVPNNVLPRQDGQDVYFDGFGSAHSGIMYFVRCDGSTAPISYTIDLMTYTRLGDRRDGKVIDGSKL